MKYFRRAVAPVGLALLFAIAVLNVQAQSVSQEHELLSANKQTAQALFESVWNEQNFDLIEDLWAPEVPFHFRGRAPMVNREGLRNQVTSHRGAFPDFQFIVEDIIAEGNRVAARVKFTGTHTGTEWFGLAATGKAIDVTEMMFFRLADGVVVEVWEDLDEYVMRHQLGAL